MSNARNTEQLGFFSHRNESELDENIILTYIANTDMKQKHRAKFLDQIGKSESGFKLLSSALSLVKKDHNYYINMGQYCQRYNIYNLDFNTFGDTIAYRMIRDLESSIGKSLLQAKHKELDLSIYTPDQIRKNAP